MSDNQDFDTELDQNDAEFGDQPQQAATQTKKSGGGILFKLVVFLVVALGGGAYFVKVSGIQLPFNIPGLSSSPAAQKQANGAAPGPVAPAGMSPEEAAAPPIESFAAMPPAVDEATGEQVVSETLKAPSNPDINSVDPMTAMRQMTDHPIQMPGADADAGANQQDATGALDPLASAPGIPQDMPAAIPSQDTSQDPLGAQAQAQDPQTQDPLADPTAAVQGAMPEVTTAPVEVANDTQQAVGMLPDEVTSNTAANAEVSGASVSGANEPEMVAPTAVTGQPDGGLAPMPRKAPVPVQAQAPSEDTVALKKRIADLESKLAVLQNSMDDLQQSIASAQTSTRTGSAVDKSTATETDAVSEARSEVRAYNNGEAPTVVKAKSARKKGVSSAPARSRSATAAAVASTSWVLKSAKTGTAWVAERGSNELKTVSVGDTLSGIGRVTSIGKNEMGRWVVNGTRGRISQ